MNLDLITVLLHTTALRGNRWELNIPKPFLKPGAFHLQQIQTVSTVKLERRLGVLTGDEMKSVRGALARRLGIEQKAT
jgi:mRNA-degrading endonuclease toxin of MazEF toxin-antitoxin module